MDDSFGFPLPAGAPVDRPPLILPGQPGATDSPAEPRGLTCVGCGCGHFRVLWTRPALGGRIQRMRECRHCGRRMMTTEKAGRPDDESV